MVLSSWWKGCLLLVKYTCIYIAYIKSAGGGTDKLTVKMGRTKERYPGLVCTEGISKQSYFWCDKYTFVSHLLHMAHVFFSQGSSYCPGNPILCTWGDATLSLIGNIQCSYSCRTIIITKKAIWRSPDKSDKKLSPDASCINSTSVFPLRLA